MMVASDGYSIVYDKKVNQITIILPPTDETARDTVTQRVKRKTELSSEELQLLLEVAKYVCKGWGE